MSVTWYTNTQCAFYLIINLILRILVGSWVSIEKFSLSCLIMSRGDPGFQWHTFLMNIVMRKFVFFFFFAATVQSGVDFTLPVGGDNSGFSSNCSTTNDAGYLRSILVRYESNYDQLNIFHWMVSISEAKTRTKTKTHGTSMNQFEYWNSLSLFLKVEVIKS